MGSGMSEQPIHLTAEDKLTPEIAAMTLRIASLMEGSNYQKLLEVMRRHEVWQAWLDRLPESSRILYQNQIPLHEDRGILLRMICGGSFGVEREREQIEINSRIHLLNLRVEAITEEHRSAAKD
jgi:hypothetical protein